MVVGGDVIDVDLEQQHGEGEPWGSPNRIDWGGAVTERNLAAIERSVSQDLIQLPRNRGRLYRAARSLRRMAPLTRS